MRLGLGMERISPNRWWSVGFASLPDGPIPIRIRPGSLPQSRQRRWGVSVGCTKGGGGLRTCKNCKSQFDPALNNPSACTFHTAHFGGETKRKFESVYTGGTMNTPDSGKVYQYWHCCGSEDPFHPGCTSAPHASYDD